MAWATARYATYAASGSFTHADLNAIQDQYARSTGLLATDLDPATLTKKLGLGATKRAMVHNVAQHDLGVGPANAQASPRDMVSGIVLETDGLLVVTYRAVGWTCDVPGCGVGTPLGVGLYMNGNGIPYASSGDQPFDKFGAYGYMAGAPFGSCNTSYMTSTGLGLDGSNGNNSSAYPVTTGQVLTSGDGTYEGLIGGMVPNTRNGGPFYVFAAAGTYTIEALYSCSAFCNEHAYVADRFLQVIALDF
jgi:hypothetical protein